MRRIAIVVTTLATMLIAAPALGGGSWMYPTEETYQPGDTVKAVGYIGSATTDGPPVARLNLIPFEPGSENTRPIWHELGPVTVEASGLQGYLSYRVSIEFTLPADLRPGHYLAEVRDPSGGFLGDLIGVGLLVGLEPTEPRWIDWPLGEPLIAELSEDAVIAGPDFTVTVADLRAGRYPASAEQLMLDPEALQEVTMETSTTHAISVYDSEAGEGLPSLPSPTARVEPFEDGGSPSGRVVIVIGLGLVAALFVARSVRRRKPTVEAKQAQPRELERSGRR